MTGSSEDGRRVAFSFLRPVGPNELFDRKEELSALLGSAKGAAIAGPWGIGKSSLLGSVVEMLRGDHVVIEVSESDSINALQALLKGLMGISKFSPEEDEAGVAEKVKDAVSSKGIKLAIVIDEWLNSRRARGYLRFRRLLYYLAKLGAARVFISSSELGLHSEAVDDPQLPFGNYISKVTVRPFDLETSVEYLYEGLRHYGASCGKRQIEEAYYLTEGFPVWLSLIGVRMVEGLCNPRGLLKDRRAQRVVVSRLLSLGKKQREMLRALAAGRKFTEVGPHSRRVLRSLVRAGYVLCNERCAVVDPVMNEMLKQGVL